MNFHLASKKNSTFLKKLSKFFEIYLKHKKPEGKAELTAPFGD